MKLIGLRMGSAHHEQDRIVHNRPRYCCVLNPAIMVPLRIVTSSIELPLHDSNPKSATAVELVMVSIIRLAWELTSDLAAPVTLEKGGSRYADTKALTGFGQSCTKLSILCPCPQQSKKCLPLDKPVARQLKS